MRSVKPGRGPSMMGGFGSAAVALFGVIWTFGALQMGAPGFFAAFGLIFVCLAGAQAVYHFKNATGEKRMSVFDITDAHEEPDPLNERFGAGRREEPVREREKQPVREPDQEPVQGQDRPVRKFPGEYCPFCGVKVEEAFDFCPRCGKDI